VSYRNKGEWGSGSGARQGWSQSPSSSPAPTVVHVGTRHVWSPVSKSRILPPKVIYLSLVARPVATEHAHRKRPLLVSCFRTIFIPRLTDMGGYRSLISHPTRSRTKTTTQCRPHNRFCHAIEPTQLPLRTRVSEIVCELKCPIYSVLSEHGRGWNLEPAA
jgi:hypothetical protein